MQETKEETMAPRGAYNRKDSSKSKEQDDNNKNLRINFLIIREMLRVLCEVNHISINLIYDYLGISPDQMSLFLTRGDGVKANVLGRVSYTLIQAGIPKKFFKTSRPVRIRIPDINKDADTYISEDSSKTDKDLAISYIRLTLEEHWKKGHPDIQNILFPCYRIINEVAPNKQTALFVANEALAKLLKFNFEKTDIQTNDFADFMKTFASSVEKIETVADKRIHHNAQNIMNTVSILLSFITAQDISKADAQSEVCLNMMQEISKTMLMIQETLLKSTEIDTP